MNSEEQLRGRSATVGGAGAMSLHIDAGGVNAEKLVLNRRSVKMSDLRVWAQLILSTLTSL